MEIPTYITGTIQTQAYRLLRSNVYDALSQYHLTPTYWSVLGLIIEAHDGIRASEVAKRLHVKAPLITMITRELINRDFIKSFPHQIDGRAKLLAITPAGKRFVKSVEATLNQTLNRLLDGLTNDDMITYHKVLTTIIANSNIAN